MKLYESKTWLYDRYIAKRMTIVEMAKEAKCSHMTIQRALEKFGLVKKNRKLTK